MATKDQGGPSRGQETWQYLTREQEEKLMGCKDLLQTRRLQPSLGFSQLYKADVGHRSHRGEEQYWADWMDSMFKWKRRQQDGNLSMPHQHWVLNWGEGLDTWEFSLRWSLVTYTRWSDGQSVGTETTTHLFMGFTWGLVPFPQFDLLKSLCAAWSQCTWVNLLGSTILLLKIKLFAALSCMGGWVGLNRWMN